MSDQADVPASDLEDSISIERLQHLYKAGGLSPETVVRNVYARISVYHDKAVWITLVPEEVAVQHAISVAEQYKDVSSRPPLYGIPFSVKDSIDIAGMPTTLACPALAYTATATAPVVQRILSAGGILIGKTNLDQFATGLNGTRSPYGIPRCVHDPDYISGGSSSGSAVSVAANLVSFTVATDTAGSTRVPASLNGVIGLKPTLGTISTVGLVPACKTADCMTIISPTIATARIALATMQHYDPDDIYARDPQQLWLLAQQPPWLEGTPDQPIRYGIPPASLLGTDTLSGPYHAIFSRFLAALPNLLHGPPSPTFNYAPFAAANAMLYDSTIVTQRLVAIRPLLPSSTTSTNTNTNSNTNDSSNPPSSSSSSSASANDPFHPLLPIIKTILTDPTIANAERAYLDIFRLQTHKAAARREFRSPVPIPSPTSLPSSSASANRNDGKNDGKNDDDDQGIDVLILPTTTCHPTVAEMQADPLALNKRLGTFTHFVNLLDLCALAVPLRARWRSGGGREMPFGITLVAGPGREGELLGLAERVGGIVV